MDSDQSGKQVIFRETESGGYVGVDLDSIIQISESERITISAWEKDNESITPQEALTLRNDHNLSRNRYLSKLVRSGVLT